MPRTRDYIPVEVTRLVKVEAGHRCAIPTCRATAGLQIHHIKEHATGGPDTFENLILLCSNCHARVTNGEIGRQDVLAYKRNLSILNGRYGDLERRVIDYFVNHPDETQLTLDSSHAFLLSYLVDDGLLEYGGPAEGALWYDRQDGSGEPTGPHQTIGPAAWSLTACGVEVIARIRSARDIE